MLGIRHTRKRWAKGHQLPHGVLRPDYSSTICHGLAFALMGNSRENRQTQLTDSVSREVIAEINAGNSGDIVHKSASGVAADFINTNRGGTDGWRDTTWRFINPANGFTLLSWYVPGATQLGTVFRLLGTSGDFFNTRAGSGRFYLYTNDQGTGNSNISTGNSHSVDELYGVVSVIDPYSTGTDGQRIYVDGEEAASSGAGRTLPDTMDKIEVHTYGGSFEVNGAAILHAGWERTLSAAEIAYISNPATRWEWLDGDNLSHARAATIIDLGGGSNPVNAFSGPFARPFGGPFS